VALRRDDADRPAPVAGLVGVYALCGIVIVAFTIAVTRSRRIGWNDAAFGALVAAFPNTGYMGVPLLIALVGNAAGRAGDRHDPDRPRRHELAVHRAVAPRRSRSEAWRTPGRSALRGVLVNPLPWAILAGIAVHEAGIVLPKPLLDTIGLLADAASPAALFTIGAVLARSQVLSRPRRSSTTCRSRS
jgi:predicted permease